jgi:hypothetical protein
MEKHYRFKKELRTADEISEAKGRKNNVKRLYASKAEIIT